MQKLLHEHSFLSATSNKILPALELHLTCIVAYGLKFHSITGAAD